MSVEERIFRVISLSLTFAALPARFVPAWRAK
jgi:hypothetical protein